MPSNRTDRRDFMGKTIAGTAGLIAGSGLLASPRALGANDKIRVGVIGCGSRGTALMKDVQDQLGKECNVEIAAGCDVWKPARDKMEALAKEKNWPKPKLFSRYHDLLEQKDIDAVIITTPDFAHSRILAEAAWAGKHAYCEKPMATNMTDANAAVDAVEANKIICQVGTQRRSHAPHYEAADLVRSGVLGVITEVECSYNRCGPSWKRPFEDVQKEDVDWDQYLMYLPKRQFDPHRYRCWHLYRDYSIGLAGLLGAHVIDVAPWFMDDPLPESAVGMGGVLIWKEGRENYDTMESLFMYPKGFIMRYTSRLGNSAGGSEVQFRGTQGTFDTGALTATGEGGSGDKAIKEPIKIDIPEGTPHWSANVPHLRNWLECIKSGARPNADVHAGYGHSIAAIMAQKSIEQGRMLRFDKEKREIV